MVPQSGWHQQQSGLLMAMLELVDSKRCSSTVVEGDILAVEYEGTVGTLESGKVFDRKMPR